MVITIDGDIEGILTERDVMKELARTNEVIGQMPVRDIMTSAEKLIYTSGDESVGDIMKLLTEHSIRHIPIVNNDGVLEGIISMRDVIRIMLKESEKMQKTLTEYISGTYPV